jgi:hypothetical protein
MAAMPEDAILEAQHGLTQGLVARQLSEAPELREPPPLTPTETQAYADALAQLD